MNIGTCNSYALQLFVYRPPSVNRHPMNIGTGGLLQLIQLSSAVFPRAGMYFMDSEKAERVSESVFMVSPAKRTM